MYESFELQTGILSIFVEGQQRHQLKFDTDDNWRVRLEFKRYDDKAYKHRVRGVHDPLRRLPKDGYVIVPLRAKPVDNPCPTCGAPRERRQGTQYLVHLGRCKRAA